MSLRLILDTNVFVAACFRPGSSPGRLIAAARAGTVLQVWSPPTRRETEKILRRLPRGGWAPVADLFTEAGAVDPPPDAAAFAFVADPDDRKFAALAAATGVTLVSSDKGLLVHDGAAGLTVRRPWQVLAGLDAAPPAG